MGKYTISFFEENGKDQRGNIRLNAKFAEDERTVYWAVKKLPAEGEIVDGIIEEGEYGPRFKRTWSQEHVAGVRQGERSQANTERVREQKSREDGAHQGMAVNNAVALLVRFAPDNTKLEKMVEYIKPIAQKIYEIELDRPDEPQEETPPTEVPPQEESPAITEEESQTIEEIFGIPEDKDK